MCSACWKAKRSYSARIMQQKAEILKISLIHNALSVLKDPTLIIKIGTTVGE